MSALAYTLQPLDNYFSWTKVHEDLMWDTLAELATKKGLHYAVEYVSDGSKFHDYDIFFHAGKPLGIYQFINHQWKKVSNNTRVPIYGILKFRKDPQNAVFFSHGTDANISYISSISDDLKVNTVEQPFQS